MSRFPFLLPFQDFDNIQSLQKLRERLLNLLLSSTFVFGTVLLGVALIPVSQREMFEFPILYVIVYIWLILVTFLRRIPYQVRATSWLFFFLVLGIVNLVLSGFNADAAMFFLTFVSMSTLLFDLRRGMIALFLSAASVGLFGYLIVSGNFRLLLEAPQPSKPLLWLIGGAVFLISSISLIIAISILIHGLIVNLKKVGVEADKLEEANRTLRLSEERYRSFVEMSPDLVATITPEGSILLVNRSGVALFGYDSPEEVAGRSVLEFIFPDDRALLPELLQKTVQNGPQRAVNCRCVRRDGSVFDFEFSTAVMMAGCGIPDSFLIVGRDISQRVRFEQDLQANNAALENKVALRTEELRRASEHLNQLVSLSPAVIYAAHPVRNFSATFLTENIGEMFGYTAEEFTADPDFWLDHIHPEDLERVLAEMESLFVNDKVVLDYRFLHRDGTYRWTRDSVRLVRDAQGVASQMVGSWFDISAEKMAEQSRRESEDRYRTLVESLNVGIFESTLDGKFVHANSAVLELAGYESLDEFLRVPAQRLYADLQDREHVLRNLTERGFVKNFELRSRKKDGSEYWVSLNAVLQADQEGRPVSILGSVKDVTDRKKMEAAMLQAKEELERHVAERTRELLETRDQLRTLTADVLAAQEAERRRVSRELHDEAGQALVSLKHGLEALLTEFPDATARERLQSYVRQVDRTMDQIRLLAHSLRPPLLDVADLDLTLRDYCEEFGKSTGLRIEYVGETIPDLSEAAGLGFFRFVQEALTNVVKHARASLVQVRLQHDEQAVSLSVADNGVGQSLGAHVGQGHLGMRERFRALNGQIKIESPAGGRGYKIVASIPLPSKAEESIRR